MEPNPQNILENIPHPAADFGNVPKAAEAFRSVPNNAEPFRTVPNNSESFGTMRNNAEDFRTVAQAAARKENHTLTVRDVARMFEAAGVARTERSIVNWCQPNRTGIARLDSYLDPNERRYLISHQSVELAIAEEKAKAAKINEPSEPVGNIPQPAAPVRKSKPEVEEDESRAKELEQEIMDLKIMNSGKDYLIGELKEDRKMLVDRIESASRMVGELKTELLQIESRASSRIEELH